ncbi:MAG: response regulator transcription factor [Proteobacteria bacterium]|nr:response regulator transcription factor [Pseudomonadota bacterium]MCP4919329.1 response regulator transcription factor [Pseudomonadota bacterium]
MNGADILIVDDDDNLREVVRYALDRAGFRVREANDGKKAIQQFGDRPPDLIVLDVLMPEMDGIEVCREIRKASQVPIVFLSSRDEEVDRVLGLELGGDDYMTKPFSPRELVSRVKAVLRRTQPQGALAPDGDSVLRSGPIKMNPERHRVFVEDEEVRLTVTEFRLLQVLLRRPGRVYTRDELVERAYPGNHHVSDRTLDSHVRRIRQKFREHEIDPVETVHGLGYRLRQL